MLKELQQMKKIFALLALLLFVSYVQSAEIHDAVRAGDLAKIKALVAKDPRVVNEKDGRGRTALHFASYAGNREIAFAEEIGVLGHAPFRFIKAILDRMAYSGEAIAGDERRSTQMKTAGHG